MTQFRLTAIKFNNDRDDITIIDWQKIQTEKTENSILTTRPRNSEILMGADANFNVSKTSKRFKDILGPLGLDNRNLKGRELLYLYKSNNFKILLSFFAHTNYITYRSFNELKTPHMLDNFISCGKFFKRISDCKVNRLGV